MTSTSSSSPSFAAAASDILMMSDAPQQAATPPTPLSTAEQDNLLAGAHARHGSYAPDDNEPMPSALKRQKRTNSDSDVVMKLLQSKEATAQQPPREAPAFSLSPALTRQRQRAVYQPVPSSSLTSPTRPVAARRSDVTESSPCEVNSLPAEMLEEVFRYLPTADMMRCRRVCRLWHSMLVVGRRRCNTRSEDELQTLYTEQQTKYRLAITDYLQWQHDLTPAMRPVLVDWMIEITALFSWPQDTLFLGVRFCDMFLSRRMVTKDRLQLVGVTCLWLSAKVTFEDIPSATEIAATTRNTYSKPEVLDMEREIALALGFHILPVTPLDYLSLLAHLVKPEILHVQQQSRQNAAKGTRGARMDLLPALAAEAANVERTVKFNNWARQMRLSRAPFTAVAQYIIELALHEYAFAAHQPSSLSAAALLISLSVCLGMSHKSSVLEAVTGATIKAISPEVRQAVKMLIHLLSHDQHHLEAIHNKYAALYVAPQ